MKTLLPYVATAIAEIVGCYLPLLWLRGQGADWLLLPAAALSLATFVWLLTLHAAPSGWVYAAYGGAMWRWRWYGFGRSMGYAHPFGMDWGWSSCSRAWRPWCFNLGGEQAQRTKARRLQRQNLKPSEPEHSPASAGRGP